MAGALAASVNETALAGAVSAAVADALPAEERDEASVTVGMRVQTNIAMNTAAYDQNDVALTAELQRSGCVDHVNGGVLGPSECAVTITCLGCTRPEGGMRLDLQITRTSAEGAPVAVIFSDRLVKSGMVTMTSLCRQCGQSLAPRTCPNDTDLHGFSCMWSS